MARRKTEPLARSEEQPSHRGGTGALRVPPSGELDLLHLIEKDAARQLWRQLVAHWDDLSRRVGRAMPLRAAAIDWLYLHQLEERPIHPFHGEAKSFNRPGRATRLNNPRNTIHIAQ